MKRYIRSSSEADRVELAEDSTDPAELAELANDPSSDVREAVAANEYTPSNILDQLADDEDDRVRIEVAYNPNISIDSLHKLITEDEGAIQYKLIQDTRLSADEIYDIVVNNLSNHHIRGGALLNPNTPSEALEAIWDCAYDYDYNLKKAIAKHRNVSPELLDSLAYPNTRGNAEVRQLIEQIRRG